MKKIGTLLLIFVLICACSQAQQSEFTPETLNAKLLTVDGSEASFKNIIEKYNGKVILMEVWASWCSDCIKAMPKLKELQNANPDIVYLFVSMDKTADKWKTGIEKHELKGEHIMAIDGMKGNFGSSIDLDWIPRYMIIDKDGKIALYRAVETDFEKIDQKLKSLQ